MIQGGQRALQCELPASRRLCCQIGVWMQLCYFKAFCVSLACFLWAQPGDLGIMPH